MKKLVYFLSISLLLGCTGTPDSLIEDPEVIQLAGDFSFTEGPAANSKGDIYFTDIPNNKIHIWTTEGKLESFRDSSNGANGLFFDSEDNLYICEGDAQRITSIDNQGNLTIITDTFNTGRYNRPNDLWIDPAGGIYFTDPAYGKDEEELEQDVEGVYYISPDYTSVILVCDDLDRPNGVIGTTDGNIVYVTDHMGGKTWVYDINPDGSLSNKTLFVEMGCDGMTIDQNGNVYLTNMENSSIDIYSPEAELLHSIKIPEGPSNVCFGGVDNKDLFITARTSVYTVRMRVTGQ